MYDYLSYRIMVSFELEGTMEGTWSKLVFWTVAMKEKAPKEAKCFYIHSDGCHQDNYWIPMFQKKFCNWLRSKNNHRPGICKNGKTSETKIQSHIYATIQYLKFVSSESNWSILLIGLPLSVYSIFHTLKHV